MPNSVSRQVEPEGPPLSAKGTFVKFDPVDLTLSGNNHKKPLDNFIIEDASLSYLNFYETDALTHFLDV